MKFDPHNNKEKWEKWKSINHSGISGISDYNSKIILQYLNDMELGINISITNKKGSRSPTRLNSLKNRMVLLAKHFEKRYNLDKITNISEEQLIGFFTKMRSGEIRKANKGIYKSVRDYAKIFKAFWHWYEKVEKKKDNEIKDITIYLDTSGTKPEWCYLDEKQVRQLCENAQYDYKVLIWFLFDSGIRSPTELMNIKVSDLYKDYKELNIRDEISKTFGRRIKLMLCSEILKEYVESKKLKQEDYIFRKNHEVINRYLKRLGKNVFGDKPSLAGKKYSQITMYDFRHISCCYWLPRYKSESALKFRFGWKKSDKIHYYSELLGMRDTISEEDLLIDVTKTEIEKRLVSTENENKMLRDEMDAIKIQMKQIGFLTNKLYGGFEILTSGQ
ncbi:MAG: tyrosine-type recombinase/integrase [Nanoarchaeota archaeon]|nr:tyrosine-type recombinase/integrase [Nanoarchaeota archaeon]